MVSVEEAEKIILQQRRDYGTESISFDNCLGRILTEDIIADRDFPPFNRVSMDGIAISYGAYKNGVRSFAIKAVQAAGAQPLETDNSNECIEIMTGAAMPATTDTIIRYEDIEVKDGVATIKTEDVRPGQNLHLKGKDKKQDEVLVQMGQLITPTIITIAATAGKTNLLVKKPPKIIILSTGDELADIDETPAPYQIRSSNKYTLRAILKEHGLETDLLHLADEQIVIENELLRCINEYDVVILSGGVSMGKFDYVPSALEKLGVEKLFHKVQQRPGKPFWFGAHEKGAVIFAFPGNPVSTFLCCYRYFLPWYFTSMGVNPKISYAVLSEDFIFKPALQYFLQVQIQVNQEGRLLATPVEGHGSGDFANLLEADAFMELPVDRAEFKKGEVFRIWVFKQIV